MPESESHTVGTALETRLRALLIAVKNNKRYDEVDQKDILFSIEHILDRLYRLDEEQAGNLDTCLAGNHIPKFFDDKSYTRLHCELLDAARNYADNCSWDNLQKLISLDKTLAGFRTQAFFSAK